MTLIDLFVLTGLVAGAVAALVFIVMFTTRANLKNKVSLQVLVLNIAIAATMILSIAHGLDLFSEDLIFLMQGVLILFIDAALVYQFAILRQAKRLQKRNLQAPNDT